MNYQQKSSIFSQFSLTKYHHLLHSLPSTSPLQILQPLIQGAKKRQAKKIYQGIQDYYQDLQTILDHDRKLAPQLLKQHKIMVNKDGNSVLIQCLQCGRYTLKFKYCEKCRDVHYCSQACQVRAKLNHVSVCNPQLLPKIDASLQMQLHVGGDLGKDVDVYYQHLLRMSLKIRGKQFTQKIFNHFTNEGKNLLPSDIKITNTDGHLKFSRTEKEISQGQKQSVLVDSIDKLIAIYSDNQILENISNWILNEGGVLGKIINEIHNNHFHMIYIFYVC